MMQAMEIKRLPVNRIIVAAVVVALLAAGTIGLVVVNQLNDDAHQGQQFGALSLPSSSVTQAVETFTLEQNLDLPTGGGVSPITASASETLYLEQNTLLPAGSLHLATDLATSPIVNR